MATNTVTIKSDWTRLTQLTARACLSAIFLISGIGKVLAPAGTVAAIEAAGLPFPSIGLALAITVELLCGGALFLGIKLRWSASILAVFALTTAVFFHSDFADSNQFTHFLKNIAIAGGLLNVIVLGRSATAAMRSA